MGQTSELEDKLSVLVLPGGTVKDADDISNGLCVGAKRMTQSRLQWSKPAPTAGLHYLNTTARRGGDERMIMRDTAKMREEEKNKKTGRGRAG